MKKILLNSNFAQSKSFYRKLLKCKYATVAIAFIGSLLLLSSSISFAQSWDAGANNTNWHSANNWNPNGIPGTNSNVTIDGTGNYDPTYSAATGNRRVNRVTINNNGILTFTGAQLDLDNNDFIINSGGTLNMQGGTLNMLYNTNSEDLTMNGGTLNFSGGTIRAKDLDLNSGTVNMSGGTLQIDRNFLDPGGNFNASGGTVQFVDVNTGGFSTGGGGVDFTNSNTQFFNIIVDGGVNPGFNDATATINVAGNFTDNGNGAFTNTTFNFNGAGAQTISGSNTNAFNTLNITNTSGTVTAGDDLDAGTTTISSNATLDLGGNTFTNTGTLTNDGTIEGTGTIVLTGGSYSGTGSISPAGTGTGTINVTGSISNAFTYDADITGSGAYDVLAFSGSQNLSLATINLNISSFTLTGPSPHCFPIITCGTCTGTPTINVIANPGFDITYNDPGCGSSSVSLYIVLPIELTSFTGKAIDKAIELQWSTATEQNNDYMAVERSADGRTFQELGRVQGAGTTLEPQEYSFIDEKPLRGLNYYRLRQVDFDGAVEYHKVVSVEYKGKSSAIGVSAFPNPANEMLHTSWLGSSEQPTTLRVLDMTGRQVAQYQVQAGTANFEVPLDRLQAGLYLLEVRQGSAVEVVRFRKG